MKIELKEILVKKLIDRFADNAEVGLYEYIKAIEEAVK
jgi:hypothetical protein